MLTFYLRPDLSAGSFRSSALVDALRTVLPVGSQIDVITTLPNRYKSFSADAQSHEQCDGLSIHRIALPTHRSGMVDQSIGFFTFSQKALKFVKSRNYDLVFATSSRLMTAALGAWIASRKQTRLYLDIRDIFVDTIKDVLPRRFAWLAKPMFSILERWTVNRAEKVNLVSGGFAEYFTIRYPRQKFSYFTNGIDDEFLAASSSIQPCAAKEGPMRVVCAGNIGEGQGLHAIIPELAQRMGKRAQFRIIGDGGRKVALQKALEVADVDNVELMPPMHRDRLIEMYRTADVLFLHLNDYEAFKKVLPSKLFEYAAMGKPIWAGLPGYSAEFVKLEISNAAVFYPCDAVAAERVLGDLLLQDTPRPKFVEKYVRAKISENMAQDILALAET
ncbi:MAG: putative glycosyl transferase [Syntrophorhabdus sp. PtaB.Bin006]|nr:MAG: putative glycosyl transferase [Syntrophorhabdus sp. PtaB.Bin006]